MADDNRTLDELWREKVATLGKRVFENEEMLRLGFIDEATIERLAREGVSRQEFEEASEQLTRAKAELTAVNREISELTDVERAIADIRARRIERVKAARAERREQRVAATVQRRAEIEERNRQRPPHLGRGVSQRLTFTGGDAAAVDVAGLPQLQEFTDLALALEITSERLQWLTYERAAGGVDHYIRFRIPKRSGGERLISSPKPALRQAQSWVRSAILTSLRPHEAATAFRPGLSIVDNATQHSGASIVVRIDLKDFFPSITFPRVRGLFESLGYNPGVATTLALLCTDAPRAVVHHGDRSHVVAVGPRGLPQGACTSPDIANLVARKLDRRLAGLARSSGWTYTRYADDLVFSTSFSGSSPHRLVRAVGSIAADEGFMVNESKTRVMRSPNRQTVTGLLVNDGVRLTRTDLRRIRAFLHQCETKGLEEMSRKLGKNAVAVARGYYAYVHMVSPEMAMALRTRYPWI